MSSTLSAQTHRAVESLARSTRSTPFMVLHTALSVLLSRMAGEPDIAIGTPVSGRGNQALDNLVGMFVGTVVLRTQVDPKASFRGLLESTRNADLSAFAHSDIPFERLVEVVDPPRSTAHHPFFQVVLATGDIPTPSVKLPGPRSFSGPVGCSDLEIRSPTGCLVAAPGRVGDHGRGPMPSTSSTNRLCASSRIGSSPFSTLLSPNPNQWSATSICGRCQRSNVRELPSRSP